MEMKEEWLMPGAIVPVDVETTATLVAEIKRLIWVVGGMALSMQPAQEPVAWMYDQARFGPTDLRGQQWLPALSRLKPWNGDGLVRNVQPLYTSPPASKPWIGLSTDEIYDMYNEPRSDAEMVEFARAIEAKLKEKNT